MPHRPQSVVRRRPSSRARRRTDNRSGSGPVHLFGAPLDTSSALEVLGDPARAALLLVRAIAAVAPRAAEPTSEPQLSEKERECDDDDDESVRHEHNRGGHDSGEELGDGATPAPDAATAEGDEDEDAERLEEENDDDDDDVADGDEDGDDALDDDDDVRAYESGDERDLLTHTGPDDDNVEAITAALELATQVVEQLKLKMLALSGESADENDGAGRNSRVSSGDLAAAGDAVNGCSLGEAGVPRIKARTVNNSHCKHCSKSFNAFHRSRSCTSCGYSYCVKCVSRRQVLPSCFGFKDEAVRVCELCCGWFQRALERYFDVMALTKTPSSGGNSNHELPRASMRRASIATTSVRSPVLAPASSASSDKRDNDAGGENGKLRRHSNRHSLATSAPPPARKSTPKPWFSGHLRAMHVGDRLPRKLTKPDADVVPGSESESDAKRAAVAAHSDTPSSPVAYERLSQGSNDIVAKQRGASGDALEATDDRHTDADDDIFEMEPVLDSIVKPAPVRDATAAVNLVSEDSNSSSNSAERRPRPRTSKKSKFSRSASFDFTNLKSAGPPSSTSTGGVDALRDDASDAASSPSARSASSSSDRVALPRRTKCFDDSDIVDSRAKADAAGEHGKSNADLPATVLRFAVYKVGPKESQSLRRTFGFGKANPVLDRYSLELDCSQGIVRVKSVFQHRFWSFHCDAVQHLSSGSAAGTAHLVVHNGVEGNLSHELQFANDDERDEFKRAVETCRTSNLHAMRRASVSRNGAGSPQLDASVLLGSPVLDDLTASTSDAAAQVSGGASQDTNITVNEPTGGDSHHEVDSKLQLLAGEVVMKGSEFPSTLLIGPGGDSSEPSQIWGRIRGTVAVTNFRVLFVPSENCYVPLRTALQGSAPYIPLFAITFVHVVYPGGRRVKASRTYSTGLPSVLTISCKDVRAMRVQLEGPPHVSDERSQHLANLISKLADDAQRIKVVERGSLDALLLATSSSPPSHLSLGTQPPPSPLLPPNTLSGIDAGDDVGEISGASGGGHDDDVQVSSSYVQSALATFGASRKSASGPAPSPNLRPSSPMQLMPLERSGSFAYSYAVDCVSPDVDGWSLFADEREFKRQIGNDPSVQPFFKYYQNARGNICKSYPSKLLLPSSMNSQTLTKVTEFRAKNRLPVITYYHRRNRCVLTRSSQPLLGNLLSGSSSLSDQLLLGVYRRLPDIIRNQSISSVSSRPLYIFDARKLKASTGNRLMGKGGVETPQDYPGAVVHHLNIANMYRMQSSFLSLMKLLMPGAIDDGDKTWLLRVESTRWLHHLRSVLDGAMKIARVLELEGSSVLVHCSDGWDRTSQLTALAQVMIDPYFRTIRGFAVLVEKDWCAFGHKFAERLGGDRSKDPQRSKSSPVMLQFLDAVWQIQRQFPHAFEFNERFLLHVANSLTSGLYGTFLFDSRLQRDVNNVRANSVSVWTPVLLNPSAFTNAAFVPWDKPIWPWTGIQIMHLWEGYFLQWHPKYYNCHWVSSATSAGSTTTTAAAAGSELPQHKIQFEQAPLTRHQLSRHEASPAAAGASAIDTPQQQRDGSFDGADAAARGATNLPSPIPDTLRSSSSNPSSVRSSRSSSARPQSAQAPKLPMRNVFIYRS